jgi:hypothetical protein
VRILRWSGDTLALESESARSKTSTREMGEHKRRAVIDRFDAARVSHGHHVAHGVSHFLSVCAPATDVAAITIPARALVVFIKPP